MNTFTAISILKNQIKEINNEIFEYVQNIVCNNISTSNEAEWTYLNLSKDSLLITAKNPEMSQVPGGTIAIDFKDESWFFRNTFGNTFTGIGSDSPIAEQVLNFNYAMTILLHYGKENEMMSKLNGLFIKKQAISEAILALLK